MKILFSSTILLLISKISLAQQSVDLSSMSESEKNKTGLYKLSENEIAVLEKWLNRKHDAIKQIEKAKNVGFEQKEHNNTEKIESILTKTYKDTLGNTYYKLINGQVWKQVQSGRITVSNEGNQNVTLEPKMMGSWMLKGDGNRGVKVKRIR